jgi:hypothetical protein
LVYTFLWSLRIVLFGCVDFKVAAYFKPEQLYCTFVSVFIARTQNASNSASNYRGNVNEARLPVESGHNWTVGVQLSALTDSGLRNSHHDFTLG